MKSGWTGGQYSVFRALLGCYLFVRFVRLIPWGTEVFSNQGVLPVAGDSPFAHVFPNILTVFDAPMFVTIILLVGAVMSICLAIGWRDRIAAIVLWYVSACLFCRNPLISNPSLPYIGWMLLAHACLPRAPFGSWEARHRINPNGAWHFPGPIFAAAWIVMALGYSYGGVTKLVSPSWLDGTALHHVLANPLARPSGLREFLLTLPPPILRTATWMALLAELAFAPMALSRKLRPVAWLLMLAMHAGLILLVDFAELSLGMMLLHLFTFDPAWIEGRRLDEKATLFYDGGCGLCHASVRWILAEERSDQATLRFAPIGGATMSAMIAEQDRALLPDSVIVLTGDGLVRCRSAAVLHILARFGGIWRVLAFLMKPFPRLLLDWVYDRVAAMRHRLFASPKDACPMLPAELRSRFLP